VGSAKEAMVFSNVKQNWIACEDTGNASARCLLEPGKFQGKDFLHRATGCGFDRAVKVFKYGGKCDTLDDVDAEMAGL
jgi:hypothetical protein